MNDEIKIFDVRTDVRYPEVKSDKAHNEFEEMPV